MKWAFLLQNIRAQFMMMVLSSVSNHHFCVNCLVWNEFTPTENRCLSEMKRYNCTRLVAVFEWIYCWCKWMKLCVGTWASVSHMQHAVKRQKRWHNTPVDGTVLILFCGKRFEASGSNWFKRADKPIPPPHTHSHIHSTLFSIHANLHKWFSCREFQLNPVCDLSVLQRLQLNFLWIFFR